MHIAYILVIHLIMHALQEIFMYYHLTKTYSYHMTFVLSILYESQIFVTFEWFIVVHMVIETFLRLG